MKISLTGRDLIGLLRQSKIAGTQNAALDLAIEWIEAADKEIARMKSAGTEKSAQP